MKILENLSAGNVAERELSHQGVTRVADMPVAGFMRLVEFGPAGLVVKVKGGAAVGIELAEILRLAESAEAGLKAPAAPVLEAVNEVGVKEMEG